MRVRIRSGYPQRVAALGLHRHPSDSRVIRRPIRAGSPEWRPLWLAISRAKCHDALVSTTTVEDVLARGHESLAAGNWSDARDSFQEVADLTDSPEALDGLGRALWWLRDERGAVVERERAYAGFRRDGELARAARVALWLAREYELAFGNAAGQIRSDLEAGPILMFYARLVSEWSGSVGLDPSLFGTHSLRHTKPTRSAPEEPE